MPDGVALLQNPADGRVPALARGRFGHFNGLLAVKWPGGEESDMRRRETWICTSFHILISACS